jgi:C4-dicarboxylate-specific signal transduction histidine kinase
MTITSLHQYRGSVEALAQAERRNLEQLAQATAGRLSQLLEDHRRLAAYLAHDDDVEAVLMAPTEENLLALRRRLAAMVATNPDLHLVTLMDAKGTAVVSTASEVVGGNFAFRDYFRTAQAGTPNVTSILIGAVAGRAGSYLAHPVRVSDGRVLGVMSLRVRAESIGALVDAARTSSREPFLIDADGVVIHHRDAGLRFRSLAPLSPAQQEALRADQRFRRDRVESLDMPDLARAMVGARHPGHADYRSTVSNAREVAGFAPVEGPGWVLAVSETHASFDAPLRRLLIQVMAGWVVVGLVATLLALAFARSIVQPVRRLIAAAEALKRGDYDAAQVRVTQGDEIGVLGRTFNVMIDVLRQRERERVLRDAGRR